MTANARARASTVAGVTVPMPAAFSIIIPLFNGFFFMCYLVLFVFYLELCNEHSGEPRREHHSRLDLYIVEKRHETVVHVQLLVTVEKRQTRIISDKVYLGFLVSAQHHNIFQDSSGRLSGQACQLKTMAMKMDRMDIVTGVTHANAIALIFPQVE